MHSANNMSRPRAFTLIEVMVVVAIIALLVVALGIGINSVRVSTRDAKRLADSTLISKAIDQYVLSTRGAYPRVAASTGTGCADELANSSGFDLTSFSGKKVPQDPLTSGDALTVNCTGMKNGYTYHNRYGSSNLATSNSSTYAIEIGLEKETSPDNTAFKRTGVSQDNRFQFLLLGGSCTGTCYR